MKIIKYILNADGTIPDYVTDGGYFASANNNLTPQDLDLIGVATDQATEIEFNTETDLLQYAQKLNLQFISAINDEPISLDIVVNQIWSKL
jgi:hypothetical protein